MDNVQIDKPGSDTVNHTFAVCAYKESKYLDEAVASVTNQTVKSKVYIVTSTPNDYITSIGEKYGVPVIVNNTEKSKTAAADWSFAVKCADTDFVTIAHQDDFYCPEYAESILAAAKKDKTIILFTDYFEIRDGERVYKNKLLKIKNLMNIPIRMFPGSKFMRRRVLSLGCSICCPAVTLYKPVCGDFEFDEKYVNNLDWEAWIRLSSKKGYFINIHKPLMGHRIHEESLTTKYISDGSRHNETLEIFERFWPKWIAKRLIKIYETSDKSNSLKEEK